VSLVDDADRVTLLKVSVPDSKAFFASVFAAAKEQGVPVVICTGPVKIFHAAGGGATINFIDRLFSWRGRPLLVKEIPEVPKS